MAKKFYAVKKGLTPGVYTSWADCQAQINGFSGAIFKGFETLEEAKNFIGGETEVFGDVGQKETALEEKEATPAEICADAGTEAVAYVDGSHDPATNNYSYGMVMFYNGKEEHDFKKYENSEYANMNNVAGEIEGARAAMQYCLDRGIKSLTIFHDYIGIAAWCTGEWQAKQDGTIAYKLFYQAASLHVDIYFQKVKAHTKVKYNELADKLAKGALGI